MKKQIKAALLKWLLKDELKATKYEGTEFAFELNGKRWYRFIDIAKMPVTRFAEIQRVQMEMQYQINRHELGLIIEALKGSFASLMESSNPKVRGNALAKLGHIITEMENRKELLFHPDLMFEMACIHYFREDEDPAVYSSEFEIAKRNEIRAAMKTDARLYDFFERGSLLNYLPVLKELKDGLMQHLSHYQAEVNSLNDQLRSFISEPKSSNSTTS